MSIRVRTREQDETTVQQLLVALSGGSEGIKAIHKYYVHRAALSLSLRLPIDPGVAPEALRPSGESGSEYRLAQLLGEDGGADGQADLVRLLLSVGHELDLFGDEKRDEHFQYLLEYHLHRGFNELRRIWSPGQDVLEPLGNALKVGEKDTANQEPPQPVERIQAILMDLGVKAQVREVLVGPRLARYVLVLQSANEYDKLTRGLDKLALAIGAPIGTVSLRETGEPLTLELLIPSPKDRWQSYGLRELQSWLRGPPSDMVLPMCPGVDILGKPYWLDLEKCPHLLVAGTTGSGKSVAVHALLCSLLLGPEGDQLELKMVDPKKVEFNVYAGISQLGIEEQALTDTDEIAASLSLLVSTMETRYEQLKTLGARDIGELGTRRSSMKRIVLVVDEVADLLLSAPELQEDLVRLAQKGRAAGIHLILATQRPDAELLTGLLRSNIPARIALAVQKASESKIILDQPGAETLLKPGDMFVRSGGTTLDRVHGVHLRNDDVASVVRGLKRDTT